MIIAVGDCASATASDEAANSAIPAVNARRRPIRSPTRAPSSSSPPKVSVYAFCAHDSPAAENRRSWWIRGSATIKIETSIRTSR